MAVKSNFAAGDVLQASDVNTYLTNGGLVYVKSQTIGSGVASQAVTSAFDSTYDNYLITVTGGSNSVGPSVLQLQLGSATTNYNYQMVYGNWGSTVSATGTTTGANFAYVGSGDTDGLWASIVVRSPYLAKWTSIQADASRSGSYWGISGGIKKDTTQYTGFTIITDTGTMTGGTIRVYGYRQA